MTTKRGPTLEQVNFRSFVDNGALTIGLKGIPLMPEQVIDLALDFNTLPENKTIWIYSVKFYTKLANVELEGSAAITLTSFSDSSSVTVDTLVPESYLNVYLPNGDSKTNDYPGFGFAELTDSEGGVENFIDCINVNFDTTNQSSTNTPSVYPDFILKTPLAFGKGLTPIKIKNETLFGAGLNVEASIVLEGLIVNNSEFKV